MLCHILTYIVILLIRIAADYLFDDFILNIKTDKMIGAPPIDAGSLSV